MLDCGKDLEICESSYDSEEDDCFNWGEDGTSSQRVENGPHSSRLPKRKEMEGRMGRKERLTRQKRLLK
jgi:hypothetical protein